MVTHFTESDVVGALMAKHAEDVCVPGCKDGPTQHGLGILDLWVMKKSWAHPSFIGYEVKVSRSDFLGDIKWRKYRDVCTELYFAAPPGVIQPEELSDGVGLILCTKSATRIKRKAVWREPDEEKLRVLMTYVLMCRATIGDESKQYKPRSEADRWREWLKTTDDEERLGYLVSDKITTVARRMAKKYVEENEELRRENQMVKEVARRLREAGVDPLKPWETRARIDELTGGDLRQRLAAAHVKIGELLEALDSPVRAAKVSA